VSRTVPSIELRLVFNVPLSNSFAKASRWTHLFMIIGNFIIILSLKWKQAANWIQSGSFKRFPVFLALHQQPYSYLEASQQCMNLFKCNLLPEFARNRHNHDYLAKPDTKYWNWKFKEKAYKIEPYFSTLKRNCSENNIAVLSGSYRYASFKFHITLTILACIFNIWMLWRTH
jgi:hypothetical protein